ncbi:hypothetical protein ACM66B_006844 [Microbotryomycetes sp. NB124-2]
MSSTTLQITYSISLPDSFHQSTKDSNSLLSDSKSTISLSLDTLTAQQHLLSLERALSQARTEANERLTKWKEVVKDFESEKQRTRANKVNDDDQDGQDDDEDEA